MRQAKTAAPAVVDSAPVVLVEQASAVKEMPVEPRTAQAAVVVVAKRPPEQPGRAAQGKNGRLVAARFMQVAVAVAVTPLHEPEVQAVAATVAQTPPTHKTEPAILAAVAVARRDWLATIKEPVVPAL